MFMQLMQYMGTGFYDLHVHYMTKLPGYDYAYELKWKQCTDVIRNEFGLVAMKALFDGKFLRKEIIDEVSAKVLE